MIPTRYSYSTLWKRREHRTQFNLWCTTPLCIIVTSFNIWTSNWHYQGPRGVMREREVRNSFQMNESLVFLTVDSHVLHFGLRQVLCIWDQRSQPAISIGILKIRVTSCLLEVSAWEKAVQWEANDKAFSSRRAAQGSSMSEHRPWASEEWIQYNGDVLLQ